MKRRPKIGDIIDKRADGSSIYMSHEGVLNLDNERELREAQERDKDYLSHYLPLTHK